MKRVISLICVMLSLLFVASTVVSASDGMSFGVSTESVSNCMQVSAVGVNDFVYVNTNVCTGYEYRTQIVRDSLRFLSLRNTEALPVYSLDAESGFTNAYYEINKASEDESWKQLNSVQKEGIALALMFGYPSQTPNELGASSKDDAYAATQAIIWEYASGIRTNINSFDKLSSPWFVSIKNSPAELVYNNLLDCMNSYKTYSSYNRNNIINNRFIFALSSASQFSEVPLVYYTGDVPTDAQRLYGSVSVKVVDDKQQALFGAVFELSNVETGEKFVLGPSDSSGIATVSDSKGNSKIVPFGNYILTETKFPVGYTSDEIAKWNLSVNSTEHDGALNIKVVNVAKKGYLVIEKEIEGTGTPVSGAVYELRTLEGEVVATIGPTDEDGYAISEGGRNNPSIPYGTYKLYEMGVPEGYNLNTFICDVVLKDNENTAATGESAGVNLTLKSQTAPPLINEPYFISGDSDGDGKVSIKDATLIQKHLAQIICITDLVNSYAADVDLSDTITIKDATVIQKYLANYNIEDCFVGEKIYISFV